MSPAAGEAAPPPPPPPPGGAFLTFFLILSPPSSLRRCWRAAPSLVLWSADVVTWLRGDWVESAYRYPVDDPVGEVAAEPAADPNPSAFIKSYVESTLMTWLLGGGGTATWLAGGP